MNEGKDPVRWSMAKHNIKSQVTAAIKVWGVAHLLRNFCVTINGMNFI